MPCIAARHPCWWTSGKTVHKRPACNKHVSILIQTRLGCSTTAPYRRTPQHTILTAEPQCTGAGRWPCVCQHHRQHCWHTDAKVNFRTAAAPPYWINIRPRHAPHAIYASRYTPPYPSDCPRQQRAHSGGLPSPHNQRPAIVHKQLQLPLTRPLHPSCCSHSLQCTRQLQRHRHSPYHSQQNHPDLQSPAGDPSTQEQQTLIP